MSGHGVLINEKGDRYEGRFSSDLKEGQGNESYMNGDSYEGEFKKGKRHGNGVYYWKSGDRY